MGDSTREMRQEILGSKYALATLALLISLFGGLVGCGSPSAQSSEKPADTASVSIQDEATTPPQPTQAPSEEPVPNDTSESATDDRAESILHSVQDVGLYSTDDSGLNYAFVYGNEEFQVAYEPDCWTVYDSYKITNVPDITLICQALLDEHPIHGRDMESFRTAEDMAFEWNQHNIVYAALPDDNPWLESVRNVDLDPKDQGMTFDEMYESRTGEKLDPRDFL